eukprot:CAMPEP_0171308770 /NCGR_PEP_ID=MMETSP0816-20121228/18873_1 /TAXON_ID=420281 /ORGANISM="Proboscia inermis, Strain CCAP1064/1" /LENGTH=114 /DNA_ID=CAMNT_0011791849 /DNA_START=367 /DNA_END=711 /DNA_ORIENTATION=+
MFDEYSNPVSYKQKFLDQNAFLVYYTKGFDGPKRPSIEEGEVPIQTLQYGFRNDAWQAMDDLLSELDFGLTETIRTDDLSKLIDRVISAVDSYISLAPSSQLDEAFRLSINKSI